jgi:hypothetical protein
MKGNFRVEFMLLLLYKASPYKMHTISHTNTMIVKDKAEYSKIKPKY